MLGFGFLLLSYLAGTPPILLLKQISHGVTAITLLTCLRVTTAPNTQAANRSVVNALAIRVGRRERFGLVCLQILAAGKSRSGRFPFGAENEHL